MHIILLRYRDNGGDWAEALRWALPTGKRRRTGCSPARRIARCRDAAPDAASGFAAPPWSMNSSAVARVGVGEDDPEGGFGVRRR